MSDLVPYKQDNLIQNFDDMQNVAKSLVASGYFADTKSISQAIVKILAGRELGLGAFASMRGVHIIKGNPTYNANIMASMIKKSNRYNYRVKTLNDKICEITFYENFNDKWEEIGVSSFSIEDARKAGTQNLDKFPRNMLFARAMSNGVRWFCPDVMNGQTAYTPEEFNQIEASEIIDAPVLQQESEPETESEPEQESEAPAPKPETEVHAKYQRPMQPEVLKEALQIKAAKAKPATEKQRNLLRILLVEHFANKDDERYMVQEYLTGHKHFAEIEPEMVNAMLDWLKPDLNPDGSGAYFIDDDAKKELNLVVRQFMEDLGQENLL